MQEADPTAMDLRAMIAAVLDRERAQTNPQPLAGQGLVVCAGGATIFTNAYVLVRLLRDTLGCVLPVEIWHLGRAEMSPRMAAILSAHGVTLVDASALIEAEGCPIRDGWQLKAFALARCRFAEVLLLDADQVPVEDPAVAFTWDDYRNTGAMFWPDIVALREDNGIWGLLGLAPRRVVSLESGQILIDKRRHRAAIALALALNLEAERLYQLIYGDKDTFLMAWILADAAFTVMPHAPFADAGALFQCDPAGRPFFQHRTGAKWALGERQIEIAGFRHGEACKRYIAELGALWNGHIYLAPARGADARRTEHEIAELRYHLFVAGERDLALELLPDGEIGTGRGPDFQNWHVADADAGTGGAPELVIESLIGPTFRLSQVAPGCWVGRSIGDVGRVGGARAELRRIDQAPQPVADSLGLLPEFLRAAGFPARDDATLLDALSVLDRLEPGVAARLATLARRPETPVADAARLAGLAALLAPRRFERRPVTKDGAIINSGYAPL